MSMLCIDDTSRPSAEHLALDEALLQAAEEDGFSETLRLWQFDRPTVVLGRSSRINDEVDRQFCETQGVEVLRRCSGGAAVVGGPGCLMYSLVLSFADQPDLAKIDVAHRYVMSRIQRAVANQLPEVTLQGICDLTWQNRKCSGNSLKVARSHVLYHGTLLHDADLALLGRCLSFAPRQPEYRAGREHSRFVTNVPIDPVRFKVEIASQFNASPIVEMELPIDRVRRLRRDRYDDASWHHRH